MLPQAETLRNFFVGNPCDQNCDSLRILHRWRCNFMCGLTDDIRKRKSTARAAARAGAELLRVTVHAAVTVSYGVPDGPDRQNGPDRTNRGAPSPTTPSVWTLICSVLPGQTCDRTGLQCWTDVAVTANTDQGEPFMNHDRPQDTT